MAGADNLVTSGSWRTVAGSLLVARAMHDRLSEIDDYLDACRFVVDLLASLSGAKWVRMDLPEDLLSEPLFCGPVHVGNLRHHDGQAGIELEEELDDGLCLRLVLSGLPPDEPDACCDAVLARFLLGVLIPRINAEIRTHSKLNTLSGAERRVLELVGLPNSDIAKLLGIENETLRTHLKKIYRKLGVHHRRDLQSFLLVDEVRLDQDQTVERHRLEAVTCKPN